MSDMMAIGYAMMAFQRQAAEQIAACKADLAARGLGFSAEDLAVIAESAAAHPYPAGYGPGEEPPADVVADAKEVARQALAAEYPADGFPPDHPKIQPLEGIPLPLSVIAGKAIGWNEDPAYARRITAALGMDHDTWERTNLEWRRRMAADVVLAAYYGQLYTAA